MKLGLLIISGLPSNSYTQGVRVSSFSARAPESEVAYTTSREMDLPDMASVSDLERYLRAEHGRGVSLTWLNEVNL